MEMGCGSGVSKPRQRLKQASSVDTTGGRLRFTVELNSDETTIVSWTNLLKEASPNNSIPNSSMSPSLEAQCSFDSHPPPPLPSPPVEPSSGNQVMMNEPKDLKAQAKPNRLNDVIERIERMYAGDGSSDEENLILDNVPDDEDEYDTEDSFIDDSELDEYFKVDDSVIKHDGFFVHRGKLEHIEPTISTDQHAKKRGHTDLTEGGGTNEHNPHKIVKKGSEDETPSSIQRSSESQSDKEAPLNVHMKSEDPMPTVKPALIQGNDGPSVRGDAECTSLLLLPS